VTAAPPTPLTKDSGPGYHAAKTLYSIGMTRMPSMTIVSWRALSLKRLAHLDELKRSGRWQRHFASEAALDEALRAAADDAEKWKRLAYQSDNPSTEAAE
jgi:hypothetical protein